MANSLLDIYNALFSRYGDLHWWPAKTPYEVIVGAVLTQNTAWHNVEKAIAGFGGKLSPYFIADADIAELAGVIRPAGYYNQKAGYLKAITAWFGTYSYDVSAVRCKPLDKLRGELLAVKGIGQETADSILLYAFGFPTFVVDAYTFRLCERYPLNIEADAGIAVTASKVKYAAVKTYFEACLPKSIEIYNNFHAMIVINGKDHCRKKPLCKGCPLDEKCGKPVLPSCVIGSSEV